MIGPTLVGRPAPDAQAPRRRHVGTRIRGASSKSVLSLASAIERQSRCRAARRLLLVLTLVCATTEPPAARAAETTGTIAVDACRETPLPARAVTFAAAFDRWNVERYGADGYSTQSRNESLIDDGWLLAGYVLLLETTHSERYARSAVLHIDRILERRDDRQGRTDYTGRSNPAWSTAYYNSGSKAATYPSVLHSAQLTYPMAYFAHVVARDACLAAREYTPGRSYAAIAAGYVAEVARTVAFHDREWRESDTRRGRRIGYYVVDKAAEPLFPRRTGHVQPTNVNAMAGKLMAAMYLATGEQDYLDRARRIANLIVSDLRMRSPGAIYWHYFPRMRGAPQLAPPKRREFNDYPDDLTHQVVGVDFVRMMVEHGLAEPGDAALLQSGLARTLMRYIRQRSTGLLTARMDGKGRAAPAIYQTLAGAYGWLAAEDSDVLPAMRSIMIGGAKLTTQPPKTVGAMWSLALIARAEARYAAARGPARPRGRLDGHRGR